MVFMNAFDMCACSLVNVALEVATLEYSVSSPIALSVEQCHCPPNYVGNSCEECADGYYRVSTGPFGGYCIPCQCNGHASNCDKATGVCHVSEWSAGEEHRRLRAPLLIWDFIRVSELQTQHQRGSLREMRGRILWKRDSWCAERLLNLRLSFTGPV